MSNIPDWNTYFLLQLDGVARRSKDPNTKIACIIAGPDHGTRSTGYNSFPRGVRDDIPERWERPAKYLWCEHCERNAIYAAAKIGTPLNGCTLYMRGLPCVDCSRGIIQVGIVEVVYDKIRQEAWEQTTPRYREEFLISKEMLAEAGVKVTPWILDEQFSK